MTETDVIIIGAGACGLAAAYELSLVNKKLLVLEAKDRLGGRIHSIKDNHFAGIVEAGAEFIHGKLPVTIRLLEKAGIKHHTTGGRMYEIENGAPKKKGDFITGWNRLMKKLRELEADIPIADFLEQYFPDEADQDLKESVLQFVQGYDAADPTRASALALRKEWEEDNDHQERIEGGYMELINFLANEVIHKDNRILLSKIVRQVKWQRGKVEVVTSDEENFTAAKLLVTIPLGVWQAEGEEGPIFFEPELMEKKAAAKKMGYGCVIKVNFQFENQFWEEEIPNKFKDAGFIFSDADIPTWWTQHPIHNGMLTGWVGWPRAFELRNANEDEIIRMAIQALAYVFGTDENFIRQKLKAHHVVNWTADPFTRGAYAYATLDTHWAKKVLKETVEQTLYFAGEALYEGTEAGTVEGALTNGIEVAVEIIAHS